MEFKFKELVNVVTVSTINSNNEMTKQVVINGRKYLKYGTMTGATMAAVQFKLNGPSINNKYLVVFGLSRQHPNDIVVTKEQGYEKAMENALISPVMVMYFDEKITNDTFLEDIMLQYICSLPIEFIKTKQEIELEGKNISCFNRCKNNTDFNYYTQYYKDFRKKFAYIVNG